MIIKDAIGRAKTDRECLTVGAMAHDMITSIWSWVDEHAGYRSAGARKGKIGSLPLFYRAILHQVALPFSSTQGILGWNDRREPGSAISGPLLTARVTASLRPAAITHAGCAAVQAHPRNKSDALLRALAERGGVVGIYELCFISPGPRQQTLEEYLAHIKHALQICGEDHVGIGSDALLGRFDTSMDGMRAWNLDIADRRARGVAAPGEGRPPFVEGLNRSDRMDAPGPGGCWKADDVSSPPASR